MNFTFGYNLVLIFECLSIMRKILVWGFFALTEKYIAKPTSCCLVYILKFKTLTKFFAILEAIKIPISEFSTEISSCINYWLDAELRELQLCFEAGKSISKRDRSVFKSLSTAAHSNRKILIDATYDGGIINTEGARNQEWKRVWRNPPPIHFDIVRTRRIGTKSKINNLKLVPRFYAYLNLACTCRPYWILSVPAVFQAPLTSSTGRPTRYIISIATGLQSKLLTARQIGDEEFYFPFIHLDLLKQLTKPAVFIFVEDFVQWAVCCICS